MKQLFLAITAAALLTACNSGLGSKKADTATTPPPAFKAPATTTAPNTIQTAPATGNATTAALNPAHGQPGHRCDIPEGAPLNSAAVPSVNIPPANGGAANIQTAPVQNIPLPSTNTTAKLNPEHGKPGHRCDIAVGAPL